MNKINKDFTGALEQAAVKAARKAGAHLLEFFKSKDLTVHERFHHDIKLAIDKECEKIIIDEIHSHFPGHSVFSEECGVIEGTEPFKWVIDPLDGTVNFFHGIPHFCTSIACFQSSVEGRSLPLLGVVYAPVYDELFVGLTGGGSRLNGQLLKLIPLGGLNQAIIALSLSSRADFFNGVPELLSQLVFRAHKIRSFGATALDIVYAASGKTGAFIQRGSHLWDFAAGQIILEEAGGIFKVTGQEGGCYDIIAANQGIYDELMDAISGIW